LQNIAVLFVNLQKKNYESSYADILKIYEKFYIYLKSEDNVLNKKKIKKIKKDFKTRN